MIPRVGMIPMMGLIPIMGMIPSAMAFAFENPSRLGMVIYEMFMLEIARRKNVMLSNNTSR